jgi:uncharacterized alpha-E superfamily protein
MLSRVAESLFWLGRNIERAETIARALDVNYSRAMDLDAQRSGRAERLWASVMRSVGFVDEPAIPSDGSAAGACLQFCAFDPANPMSIVSSVRVARTSALGIRADLTMEVWEVVNVLYLYVEEQQLRSVLRSGPAKFLRRVRDWTLAFAGVGDATMTHGDGWNFLQVGRFLERAYLTARILEALDVENEPWHESQRLLEMCCASVPFAQSSHRAPEARDAVEFIALSPLFPRSLRFCIREVEAAMHRLSRAPAGTAASAAERRLGLLRATLDFTTVDELLHDGLHEAARSLVRDLETLSFEIGEAYFPRVPLAAAGPV